MRNFWRMRKIYIPQAIATLAIVLAIVCSPLVGVGIAMGTTANNDATGAIITTTMQSETIDGEAALVTNAMVITPKMFAEKEEKTLSTNALSLSQPVKTALAKMGLSAEHIDLWVAEHPNSTLKGLGLMTTAKQRQVANIATFIRKINKKVSPKIAWREASALVFYSQKYGVPAELSVGVAKTESRFNPSAQSKYGACGVMQVMWKIHNGMLSKKGIATKKDHMFDPERGVEAGVLILSRYMNAYGTVQKALNRYYGGISRSYLSKINKNMAMLQRHSNATGF